MTTPELLIRTRGALNRPADDDKFPDPQVYNALSDAARELRREIGLFEPTAIDVEKIRPPADSTGSTYELEEIPQAGLRVFTPPGPVGGTEIFPTDFGQDYGYILAGKTIRLVTPRIYSPGLYVRYVPVTPAVGEGADADQVLPEWAHTAWFLSAAVRLAVTPGSRINVQPIKALYDNEWGEVRRQRKMKAPAFMPEESLPAWYEGMA